jgi:hypothetical protein
MYLVPLHMTGQSIKGFRELMKQDNDYKCLDVIIFHNLCP